MHVQIGDVWIALLISFHKMLWKLLWKCSVREIFALADESGICICYGGVYWVC